MRVGALCWILGLGIAACTAPVGQLDGHPFLDGDCSEYPDLGADRLALADGVQMLAAQDSEAVYLCLPLTEGSFGMMEIEIDTPELVSPLNLHISAQLGEWPLGAPAPDSPTSEVWWNTQGWFANTAAFNGMTEYDGVPGPRFKTAKGREVVLSKSRFGTGPWDLRFRVSGLVVDGQNTSLTYPADDEAPYVLTSD